MPAEILTIFNWCFKINSESYLYYHVTKILNNVIRTLQTRKSSAVCSIALAHRIYLGNHRVYDACVKRHSGDSLYLEIPCGQRPSHCSILYHHFLAYKVVAVPQFTGRWFEKNGNVKIDIMF